MENMALQGITLEQILKASRRYVEPCARLWAGDAAKLNQQTLHRACGLKPLIDPLILRIKRPFDQAKSG